MKLEQTRRTLLISTLLLLFLFAGECWQTLAEQLPSKHGTSEKQLYVCGMHPQVIQDKPGDCPICGMKLEAKKISSEGTSFSKEEKKGSPPTIKYYKSTMMPGETRRTPGKDSMGMEMVPVYEDESLSHAVIAIDPVTIQNMGIRTEILSKGPLRRVIRTVAMVDYDETSLSEVTTKFKGWIEKLYVDKTGQQVHRGDPLFEIYSPELYTAQTEFLLALESPSSKISDAETVKNSALTKLAYLDVSDDQIGELERTRRVKKSLHINAPRDGVVVEKLVVENQMVEPGAKLYRLADLSIVWIQAQVYEQDLPFIRLGQEAVVNLSYLSDRKFRGRVTAIYPTVDEKTRTTRVRMEFHNPGYFLKPGMFATVELKTELAGSVLLVPDSAVLRSGEKNTVFVALDGGRFEPRKVTLGPRSEDNRYQVLGGLLEGEKVVVSGQFMLDSESQLREAVQKMLRPDSGPANKKEGKLQDPHAAFHVPAHSSDAPSFICPMPEHVSIEYDHSGKCPLCGMTLVPVSKELFSQIQPGARVDHYSCPMAEHADVRADRPGKCPRCNMTLIPIMTPPSTSEIESDAHGH